MAASPGRNGAGGSRRTAASAFGAVRVLLWNSSLFTLNAPSLL